MSREGKIASAGELPVDAEDILAALARGDGFSGKRRTDAVTCYLSASDGWREASAALGGAFAPAEEGSDGEKEV